MNRSLVHRGPDDEGYFINRGPGAAPGAAAAGGPQVGLAMRRLAIIDLATGHQPIANEDETCHIVFNGEIYNHRELRRELEAKGHRFRTESDTESILHAYEEYGVDCVQRLRGMFAFAIWDARRECLFLARDPVGIKPLYWVKTRDTFLFASEIKALLVHPDVRREVDEAALSDYLTYLYVPPPRTMFSGISKLPPGCRLIWERGVETWEEYWQGPASLLQGSPGQPVEPAHVWQALRESVEAHLLSDVPLGAFLSGGLDSLAIVTAMAEMCREPVRTFTIGFRDGGLYNELDLARTAAQHVGARHHEVMLGPECVEDLPEVIRMLDEPLADASVLPNYAVARLARQEVKVALSGAGGDELFGGYQRYRGEAMAARCRFIPGVVRRSVLLPALRCLPKAGDSAVGDRIRLAQKFLEPLDLPMEQRYLAWNSFFSDAEKTALGRPGADSWKWCLPLFERVSDRPFMDQAMYVDLKSYLPGDPLFLADRMTMAHSLEGRVPFVDPKLMEFAYRIPAEQKIRGSVTKQILRKALAGRVPEGLLHRPKRGFGTPADVWLRGPWQAFADEILSPESLARSGYFDPAYVQRLLAQHRNGSRDLSQYLWALIVFQLWHRLYIEPAAPPTQPVILADLGVKAHVDAGASRQAERVSHQPVAPAAGSGQPRIAVLKVGGIGDTLSALPALSALRAAHPEARIHLLTNSIGAGLLWDDGGPRLADEVLSLNRLYSGSPRDMLSARFWSELWQYRSWARRFAPEVFVCFHDLFQWRDSLRPALLALLAGSRRRLGRAEGWHGWFLTEVAHDERWIHRSKYQRNLDVIRRLALDSQTSLPRLSPGPAAVAWAREQRAKCVPAGCGIATFHLLGSRESRHWPAEHFMELARWIQKEYGLHPCLVGAPSEHAILERAAQASPGAVVILPPNLQSAAAWLAQSDLVVGNDSGIVHMAVAARAPTVSIFGPGEHQIWGYWGVAHYEMVRLELPCWPCYRPSCGATPCLARLPVLRVAAAVRRVLANSTPPDQYRREVIERCAAIDAGTGALPATPGRGAGVNNVNNSPDQWTVAPSEVDASV